MHRSLSVYMMPSFHLTSLRAGYLTFPWRTLYPPGAGLAKGLKAFSQRSPLWNCSGITAKGSKLLSISICLGTSEVTILRYSAEQCCASVFVPKASIPDAQAIL